MVKAIIIGFLTTLKYLFRPTMTVQYPNPGQKVGAKPRYRGLQVLERGADRPYGCVACGLCEKVCPAEAIKLAVGENADGTRYPITYELDGFRCIFCGQCERVCPVDAIKLTTQYENAVYTREELEMDRERLLARGEGRP